MLVIFRTTPIGIIKLKWFAGAKVSYVQNPPWIYPSLPFLLQSSTAVFQIEKSIDSQCKYL